MDESSTSEIGRTRVKSSRWLLGSLSLDKVYLDSILSGAHAAKTSFLRICVGT